MKPFTYRNKTDHELTIIGAGLIAPNATITSDIPLENANLELIDSPEPTSIVGTEVQQPSVITDAHPVETRHIEVTQPTKGDNN